jgi:hypothetical protein
LDTRNIEQGFALGHKNVHFLQEELEQHQQLAFPLKAEAQTEYKKAIEANGKFKKVPLDPRAPDRAICLSTEQA